MGEPKYDEDSVNLGYLNKRLSSAEEKISSQYENVSRNYGSKPNPPYYEGDTWIDGKIVYTCINTRTIGLYNDEEFVYTYEAIPPELLTIVELEDLK